MTNPTPRDSAQLPPHFLQSGVFSGEHHKWVIDYAERYAREALRAQAASVEPVGTYNGSSYEAVAALISDLDGLDQGTKLYAGAPPAHVPADVEALDDANPLMALAECAALLENPRLRGDGVRCEVAAKNARSAMHLLATQPQAVAASSPATAADAVGNLTLLTNVHAQIRYLIDDLTTAVDDDGLTRYVTIYGGSLLYSNFIGALIPLAEQISAALQASRQPQPQSVQAKGGA